MNIEIKSVDETRYPTLGDYYKVDDKDIILVLDTKVDIYNKLVAVHELIESICIEYNGIKEEEVYNFDIQHLDYPNPGFHPDAPYRKEHILADLVERLICSHLNIDYISYDAYIEKYLVDKENKNNNE